MCSMKSESPSLSSSLLQLRSHLQNESVSFSDSSETEKSVLGRIADMLVVMDNGFEIPPCGAPACRARR